MANNQVSSNLGSHESDRKLEVHIYSTSIQATIGTLIFILLTTLQVMFQNEHNSPFKTHALIMKIFVVCAFVYASVAVATTLQVKMQYSHFNTTNYVPVLNHLGLVLGAFVCDLLLLILVPPFGYFVLVLCILMLLILLLKSYQQIVELICDVAKLALDGVRDLLRHVYENYINAWIQQIILMLPTRNLLQRSNTIAGSQERQVADYDLESNEEIRS